MRTREKKRIVRLFLKGWGVQRITALYWYVDAWSREAIEEVIREALRKRVEP